jgi:hypothetical protein
MTELEHWTGEGECVILRRFREEHDRQREGRERFERAVGGQWQGQREEGQGYGLLTPYVGKRFRKFRL